MKRDTLRQEGTALVEFALSFSVFCMLMFGVIEFSRAMLAWNTASEATRIASRMARMCDNSDPQWTVIRDKARFFVEASGQVNVGTRTDWLVINYSPKCYESETGTSGADPCWVETRLNNLSLNLSIPFVDVSITLPEYRTKGIREVMSSTISAEKNPACG